MQWTDIQGKGRISMWEPRQLELGIILCSMSGIDQDIPWRLLCNSIESDFYQICRGLNNGGLHMVMTTGIRVAVVWTRGVLSRGQQLCRNWLLRCHSGDQDYDKGLGPSANEWLTRRIVISLIISMTWNLQQMQWSRPLISECIFKWFLWSRSLVLFILLLFFTSPQVELCKLNILSTLSHIRETYCTPSLPALILWLWWIITSSRRRRKSLYAG